MPSKMSQGLPNRPNAMQKLFEAFQRAQQVGPQTVINELSQQYPQAAQQIQNLMQMGQNPMQFALNMMRQQGGNPEALLSMMSSMRR